jgi:hypothetical protein
MRDAIIFLMGVAPGIAAGWMARDFKIHVDARRREDNILRVIQDRLEREAANQ